MWLEFAIKIVWKFTIFNSWWKCYRLTEFEAQPVNTNGDDETAHRKNEAMTKTSDTVTLEELPCKKLKLNGDTYISLLNDVKSLSFLIENDQEKFQSCLLCITKSKRRERMRSS